jgi:hypothetical protein
MMSLLMYTQAKKSARKRKEGRVERIASRKRFARSSGWLQVSKGDAVRIGRGGWKKKHFQTCLEPIEKAQK